jgi:hypothetical protein
MTRAYFASVPHGCGQRLEMILLKEVEPRWDLSVDRRGRVSLHPSVWLGGHIEPWEGP